MFAPSVWWCTIYLVRKENQGCITTLIDTTSNQTLHA